MCVGFWLSGFVLGSDACLVRSVCFRFCALLVYWSGMLEQGN